MQKTKLQIISRLWSHVNALLAIIDGKSPLEPLEKTRREIDLTEYYCRPYADCDDDELYADYVRDMVLETRRKKPDGKNGEVI